MRLLPSRRQEAPKDTADSSRKHIKTSSHPIPREKRAIGSRSHRLSELAILSCITKLLKICPSIPAFMCISNGRPCGIDNWQPFLISCNTIHKVRQLRTMNRAIPLNPSVKTIAARAMTRLCRLCRLCSQRTKGNHVPVEESPYHALSSKTYGATIRKC